MSSGKTPSPTKPGRPVRPFSQEDLIPLLEVVKGWLNGGSSSKVEKYFTSSANGENWIARKVALMVQADQFYPHRPEEGEKINQWLDENLLPEGRKRLQRNLSDRRRRGGWQPRIAIPEGRQPRKSVTSIQVQKSTRDRLSYIADTEGHDSIDQLICEMLKTYEKPQRR